MSPGNCVAQIVESSGPQAGRAHELSEGEHVIGRGGAADVVLEHKDVSRLHVRVVVGPEGLTVSDLGSKNGVLVDGRPLTGPTLLSHGQCFALGELVLTVEHPASQVSRALAEAGETTVTTARRRTGSTDEGIGLVLPIIGVLVFGALVLAMLLL